MVQHAKPKSDPGYYRIRLVDGGPFVAASVHKMSAHNPRTGEVIDGDDVIVPYLDGRRCEPHEWKHQASRIWSLGQPITKGDHDYMVDRAAWARANAPHEPEANPLRPVMKSKVVRF